MRKFEVGQKLETRSICDHDCVYSAVVLKRTAKSVTIKLDDGRVKNRRVFIYDDRECIMPFGRYSMAPTFRA